MNASDFGAHIGRSVLYMPAHAHISQAERGVVTSVNDSYVFVRFGSQVGSQACRPDSLRLEFHSEGGSK